MRHTFAILVTLAGAMNASAQLEIRPHLGINYQNFTSPPPLSDWKGEAGFQGGVSFMLGSQVYFQPGVQYMSTNTELSTTILGQTFSATLNAGYLRIPLHLGFRFVHPEDEPTINPRVFAGFAASFPMSATFDESGLGDVEMGTGNFAVGGGAGLDISIFFIEAGYFVGLNPVFDDDRFDTDAKANLLTIEAGVRLKFAK